MRGQGNLGLLSLMGKTLTHLAHQTRGYYKEHWKSSYSLLQNHLYLNRMYRLYSFPQMLFWNTQKLTALQYSVT